jgi:hypothetical protein
MHSVEPIIAILNLPWSASGAGKRIVGPQRMIELPDRRSAMIYLISEIRSIDRAIIDVSAAT